MNETTVFHAGVIIALFAIAIFLIAIASHLYNISVSVGKANWTVIRNDCLRNDGCPKCDADKIVSRLE